MRPAAHYVNENALFWTPHRHRRPSGACNAPVTGIGARPPPPPCITQGAEFGGHATTNSNLLNHFRQGFGRKTGTEPAGVFALAYSRPRPSPKSSTHMTRARPMNGPIRAFVTCLATLLGDVTRFRRIRRDQLIAQAIPFSSTTQGSGSPRAIRLRTWPDIARRHTSAPLHA
jgi:hypothetical protein